MRVDALLAACLVVLVGSAIARAGVDQEVRVGTVSARIVYQWPTALGRGYAPLFAQLKNLGDHAQTVALSAHSSMGASYDVHRELRLQANESRVVELSLPLDPSLVSGVPPYSFHVAADGDQHLLNGAAGEGQPPGTRHVLWLSAKSIAAVTLERLSDVLGSGESERRGRDRSPGKVRVHGVGVEFLPQRWEAYSSVDAVLTQAEVLPHGDALEALLAWVRSGGLLLVYGMKARTALVALPQLQPWDEERFVAHGNGATTWSYFLGRVIALDAAEPLDDGAGETIRTGLAQSRDLVPQPSDRHAPTPEIPGLGELPHRTFALLLCLFVLAIGPINLHVLKRLNRPALLLLTVPAIALVTSLLLLGYGILYQGLDVKTASDSITVLDQRMHHATTNELRKLFAGMAPADGLRPAAGTACFPILDLADFGSDHYRIEIGEGTLLAGSFLPARRAIDQCLASDAVSRLRVRLHRSGNRMLAENALGVAIKELVAHDPNGTIYEYRESATWEPGREVELHPNPAAPGITLPNSRRALAIEVLALAPATYIAVLERSPFLDACGIECHERASRHRLIGILEASEEAWQ